MSVRREQFERMMEVWVEEAGVEMVIHPNESAPPFDGRADYTIPSPAVRELVAGLIELGTAPDKIRISPSGDRVTYTDPWGATVTITPPEPPVAP